MVRARLICFVLVWTLATCFISASDEDSMCATRIAARRGLQVFDSHKCKRVHFVRHAQAQHNLDAQEKRDEYYNHHTTEKYRDTLLTPLGEEQATRLGVELARSNLIQDIQVVITSPLRRAMQTATLAFHSNRETNMVPIVASELARERIAHHACDWRLPKSTLAKEFPHVDLSLVESEEDALWHVKEDVPDHHDSHACKDRGMEFLSFLMQRPETEIAVVSHWVFLQHLFRNFDREVRFENAQLVSMHLCDNGDIGLQP